MPTHYGSDKFTLSIPGICEGLLTDVMRDQTGKHDPNDWTSCSCVLGRQRPQVASALFYRLSAIRNRVPAHHCFRVSHLE